MPASPSPALRHWALHGVLLALKLLLAPVLLIQGARVRRRALELPEAPGPRLGQVGADDGRQSPLRLLIVGDSSAAGVGALHQDQALAVTVAHQLHQTLQRPVHWQLVASTGWTSACAVAALPQQNLQPADVWVSVLGVNDVVRQVGPTRTLRNLLTLQAMVHAQSGAVHWVHCAVPPLHRFPLLPAPLRWVLGAQARLLNQTLVAVLVRREGIQVLGMPPGLSEMGGLMAEDGFHPGPAGYALWGQHVARQVADVVRRGGAPGLKARP
ncbi:SGNH/GDSL hydrolase family protein [Inhella gelatinilytica]|uniref:SGNH/GDSL hydrolase family protein n=1 Tax=Inhella gelatinilytica TaxID=2795030 RepID=A0A931IUS3_9BURK|nr:SGNH/GDSL hydrolase family protein [Inhella gelatinilytica]MBH9552327.1 SGNH/GDSL hydrolase family protein [Inhella gelatinilytica]